MTRTLAAIAIALGALVGTAATASAEPGYRAGEDVYAIEVASQPPLYEAPILLSQVGDELDTALVCRHEDGSDVIPSRAGRCVWTDPDTGDAYLTYEDRSYLILDDTAR